MNLRTLFVVALATLALTGCDKAAPPASTATESAADATTASTASTASTAPTIPSSSSTSSTSMMESVTKGLLPDIASRTGHSRPDPDPCSLLDPKQVEPILGEPLAVPPYREDRNGHPDADGDKCVYRGKDLHSIKLDVDWTDGKRVIKAFGFATKGANAIAKGEVKLPISGTTLDGDWDEAVVANCCTLMALRDDTLVTIDVGSSRATQEQAAKLADGAMKNLAKPLPINGAAGVAAATALLKIIPSVASDCALLTRAEAEAIIGPLNADPLQRDNYCAYRFTNARGERDELGVTVKANGFDEFRQINNIYETADQQSAQAAAGLNANDKALLTGLIGMNSGKPEGAGPWDDATSSQFEFDLVRHDILVKIDATLKHDQMRALAEKIGAKL